MATEKFTFQAEVGKLLDIVAHSLYSEKEVFLRELVSNASDACDKLRYQSLTNPKLLENGDAFQVEISIDKKAKTLTVSDNGIGMNHDDLAETLGTIARSGTQAFMDGLKAMNEEKAKNKKSGNGNVDLIGQFGVGFYSSFMVATQVDVITRKAGEKDAWKWSSDGKGEFTIENSERTTQGTQIVLHLNKDAAKEYLEPVRIENIIKKYSDHIGIPIVLKSNGVKAAEGEDGADKTLNTASALWTREKKDVKPDQYNEFFHHIGGGFGEPWLTLHNRVEGLVSYTNLLFIPSTPPFDLFQPDRKSQIRLYVKRVFITSDCDELLPSYLRFMRGVVDCLDLPLNISREMLQNNPQLVKIKKGLTKRIIGELKKKADKKPEEFKAFWDNFGAVFKEGLYEDFENRDKLLEVARFTTINNDALISLADYVAAMKPGQKDIYYITGENIDSIIVSPQLEGFRAKGIDVLLLTDPVDEFWATHIGDFMEKSFKSATRGDIDLDDVENNKTDKDKDDKKDDKSNIDPLIAIFKVALGVAVKDVRVSSRLTESPVCLVADEGAMDIHLERMLQQNKQMGGGGLTPRILEINADNALIKSLNGAANGAKEGDALLTDAAFLLLDQARIIEGEKLPDPQAFAKRLNTVMAAGFKLPA